MRLICTLSIFLFALLGVSQTKALDSLSIALAFETADSLKVDTSLEIIENLYQTKDFNRALQYIQQSEKLSTELNYLKGIAGVTYYKALIYAKKDDYINAMAGYTKAKIIFKQLNDTVSVAKVNNSIGLIEMRRGNFTKGLKYVRSAIDELERKGLRQELRYAYASLGEAYYEANNVDKAIDYNLKALKIQEYLRDYKGVYNSSLLLAKLYSKTREHRKAIKYYENVLNNANGKSDSVKRCVYPKLGNEYLNFNDYQTATRYLLKGLKLNKMYNDKRNLLATLNALGRLNLKEKRLKVAERQLLEAGKLAKTLNSSSELLMYYKSMKALDSTKKKFDRAFIWQRKYYTLKDSINKPKPITELKENVTDTSIEESSYETMDTVADELEVDLITTERISEHQAILERYQILFYSALGLLTIAIVFLVLLYLKRSNSVKYAQELEDKHVKVQLENEAFEEQTKHLENVNSVKDKLFSIVSHDLKDSLSSINGFIDLLRDGSLSREEFDTLIPELSENANNASLLLFNLLNWSKSQMQSLKPSPSLFDIQDVFDEKIKLIEQRLENKGIELINHSHRDFAYADKSMFEIIIQNLLANALKFSRKGDSVTISNHVSNGHCIVSIADTGIGISKQAMDKLFTRNGAHTTMGTNNEKGTGLGLSICKELVELNDGKIWVESTPNVGSTFFVQLPKAKALS